MLVVDKNKLGAMLISKCWNVKDLSTRAKIGSSTLYRIMNKTEANLNYATLGKIAKALEVDPVEIIKG